MGYSKDFYILSDKYIDNKPAEQNTDISVVNPTQAAVDQAKSEVKYQKTINRPTIGKYNQTGGKSGKKSQSRLKKVIVNTDKRKTSNQTKRKKSSNKIRKKRLEKVL